MAQDDSARQRRLAEALRANLRRRKGQARERDRPDDAAGAGVDDDARAPGAVAAADEVEPKG